MSADHKIQITVSQGTVIGQTQPLPNGQKQYVFKGIPYAEAPINNLRFQVRLKPKIYMNEHTHNNYDYFLSLR